MSDHNESYSSLSPYSDTVKPSSQDVERFFSKVVKHGDGCWLWMAGKARFGHGCFYFNHRLRVAHRMAWLWFKGEIPNGLCVLHNCPSGDNPSCVNPDHLWLGTHADNVKDCISKRRNNIGERNGGNKLTEDQMREIRMRRESGETLVAIASKYGISFGHVSAIARRVKWKQFA